MTAVKFARFSRSGLRAAVIGAVCAVAAIAPATVPQAWAKVTYATLTGSGSTWSQPAFNAWIADVHQNSMTVNYGGGGSTKGRQDFKSGLDDFAGSDIPYGLTDSGITEPL